MGAETSTAKLRDLLLDVANSRREFEDDPQQFLEILVGAAALYPVFNGWPSPVDEWLEEAERLAQEVDAGAAPELWQETMGLLAVRRAMVSMRRGEPGGGAACVGGGAATRNAAPGAALGGGNPRPGARAPARFR